MRGRYVLLGLVLLALTVVGFAAALLLTQPTSVTVTGVLRQGVEAGCTILEADNGEVYTLVDMPNYRCGSSALDVGQIVFYLPPYGRRVMVTGFIEQDAASYCMQGPLLHVEDMTVLD